LTTYAAENASVDAVADGFTSAGDASFDFDLVVTPAALTSFAVSAPTSVVYNQNFTLVTTARDSFFNTVTTTASDATIAASSGSLSSTSIPVAEFNDDGVATTTLLLGGASVSSPVTLTVTSGGKSGSVSFTVTGLPSGTGGGGNYSSGSGGSATNGVGGPPPEDTVPPATSTLPLVPTTTPAIVTSTPVAPVVVPVTPKPVVKPPAQKPIVSGVAKPSNIPAKTPVQTLVVSTSNGKKQLPITIVRNATGKLERTMTLTTDTAIDLAMKVVGKGVSVRGFVVPVAAADDGALMGQPGATATYTFAYTDENRDGIYTATLLGSVFGREDKLITVVAYDDVLKPREVSEIIVRNVSGSVVGANKQPIEKAFVTLLKQNEETGLFERWPAEDVGRPNPVLTEKSGHYYFAPPAGTYRLEVLKVGYENYQSAPLKIADGQVVNFDVTLQAKTSLSRIGKGLLYLFTRLKEFLYK
jgi:hypothetical protein